MEPYLFPVASLGICGGLVAQLQDGPRSLSELALDREAGDLFQVGSREPAQRLAHLARALSAFGLAERTGETWSLTSSGLQYARAATPEAPFSVTATQAAIVRQLVVDDPERRPFQTLRAMLEAADAATAGLTNEQFGRLFAELHKRDSWGAGTLRAQGGRWTRVLHELGLVTSERALTSEGQALVAEAPALPEASRGQRAWIIRAGRDGENEALAHQESVALIGWSELGPLTAEHTRGQIRQLIRERFGETRSRSLDSQASSIYRFIHEVAIGDVVVIPLQSDRQKVTIGVVTGAFFHRADGPFAAHDAHYLRPVRWLAQAVPYERLDDDLVKALGAQGTLSEIHRDDSVSRLLAATRPADESIHLLAKWAARYGADTAEDHRRIAAERGETWWGLRGREDRPKVAARWRQMLDAQLERAIPTRVYISGPTSWVAELLDIADHRDEIDPALVPVASDDTAIYGLWLKLGDFQPIERAWMTEHLELATSPGQPLSDGALSNQTNPLIVRATAGETGSTRRVWWVCQGTSYAVEHEHGFMWAPKAARDGTSRAFWRALEHAEIGDLVLHYAVGQIRAVSTIAAEAVDAPRPADDGEQGDDANGEGWLVRTDYRPLDAPLALNDIPEQWRLAEDGPFNQQGGVRQGYFFPLSDGFVNGLAQRFPELGLMAEPAARGGSAISYAEPPLTAIETALHGQGLRISSRALRRYHLSLKTRGFVILAGISGGGKTWLAESYANTVGAALLVLPVAPNWTSNEDLLGYFNPIDTTYYHTLFSRFLLRAAAEHAVAEAASRHPRPFHVVLDEMNLARVEHYFAKFLSAMESRARGSSATIALADDLEVQLTPNLKFIGTVNVDETTLGFSNKVYDRAQLIALEAPRAALSEHLEGKAHGPSLLAAWDAVSPVAPFAFRVLDEVDAYVAAAAGMGVGWEDALDDQLLQKILPKLRGTDPKLQEALEALVAVTAGEFPLSHGKASSMLEDFRVHGFASYF